MQSSGCTEHRESSMRHTPSRAALGTIAVLAIMLTGLVAVTPAGATIREQATTAAKVKWGKVWTKKIQPKADQRYYTKAQTDTKYAGKGEGYSKAESDAAFAPKGQSYTKAESDARHYTRTESDAKYYARTEADATFQPRQQMYRGSFGYGAPSDGPGDYFVGDLSFGVTLAAAPAAHYIRVGAPPPAECPGTVAAPRAAAGHLCVFEAQAFNTGTDREVTNLAFTANTATPVGALLYADTGAAPDYGFVSGSWAMQPGGAATVTNAKALSPSFGPTGGMPH